MKFIELVMAKIELYFDLAFLYMWYWIIFAINPMSSDCWELERQIRLRKKLG